MPRLLQINECLNLSTGKIAQQIGELALKNGWESWIAYSGREKTIKSKSKLIRVGSYFDSCVHYAIQKLLDNEGMNSSFATKQLIGRIEAITPDIIHLHNIHDHWLNYSLLFDYIGKNKIPVVWTQHDCWSFTGGCMYFDMFDCQLWKTGCDCCPDRRSLINNSKRNFVSKKHAIEQIDQLVFVPVSNWLGDHLKDSFLGSHRVVTIHNGVDVSIFSNSIVSSGKTKNSYEILGVAAVWDARKGLHDFVKLRSLLPLNEYNITLVGLTEKQIRELPVGINGIRRTNTIEELVSLYSKADVFVNPTYSDNFPTTNIEALSCGTPVITYNTGGSPEAIDENCGRVIPQGDIEGIASVIQSFKANPLSSQYCRERVECAFEKKLCYSKYLKLYHSLLKE